jgi:WD40 repeat protein
MRPHNKAVKDLLFMNDGKTLYSASLDGYLIRTDLNIFSSNNLEGNEGPISAIANPLNGLTLFTANGTRICEWDILQNKYLVKFDAHDYKVTGLLYIHHRDILVSCSKDKNIRIWNPITKECLGSLEGHLESIKSLTFGYIKEHLNIVSIGKDSVITFWDLDDKDFTKSFRMRSVAKSVFYLGDRKSFMTVHGDRKFYIWNTEKEESKLFFPENINFTGYTRGCYMDDGTSIVLSTQDRSIQLWQ